ncbi:MAG: serine hydrolase domain-containing protein [Aestuariibacter sp.]
MRLTNTIFGALACSLLLGCASSPKKPDVTFGDNYEYTKEKIAWQIGEAMDQADLTGMSIALVDDQEIVWSQGFGYADQKAQVKAKDTTIYRAGSIAKIVTAMAAMQLVEKGKLNLDTPIEHYLPELKLNYPEQNSAPITIRNIMTHHSGLPSDHINGMWGDNSSSYKQLPELIANTALAHTPNSVHAYSNIGFTLLGLIIERVSGQKYADYVRQNLLLPMGMTSSDFGHVLSNAAESSKGYSLGEEQQVPHIRDVPAGGLNANVLDLAKLAKLLFNDGILNGKQILNKDSLDAMLRYQDGNGLFDVNKSMGLAWFIDQGFGVEAGPLVRHGGATLLFNSELLALPKHKLAVVVMNNSASGANAAKEVARAALKLMLESKTGISVPEVKLTIEEQDATPDDLQRIPGTWSSLFGPIKIYDDDNQLVIKADGQTLNMVRHSDGLYYLQYSVIGLIKVDLGRFGKLGFAYQNIADREFLIAHRKGMPVKIFAEKAIPNAFDESWASVVGSYKPINNTGDIKVHEMELLIKDGFLIAELEYQQYPNEPDIHSFILSPLDSNKAVVHGIGRNTGDRLLFESKEGKRVINYAGFTLVSAKQ